MPLTLICYGFLVLLAGNNCAFPTSKGIIYRALVWIGNRSYSYYVFHFPILLLTWLILFKWFPTALTPPMHYAKIQAAIAIPLLVLTVEPIYRWVELPLTRFGKRLVEGRRQPARMENAGVGELLKRAA
jgi:peptidoglycan/LPS O-acetylase OafA/YrhL